MKIPSIERAEQMLAEAGEMNPGKWTDHSKAAAKIARLIAERCQAQHLMY